VKRLLLIFISFLAVIQLNAQLVINTAATPAQMVANMVGGGLTVSNIQYVGAAQASATFTGGGGTNLGINSGIILTSGNAALAIGPNNSGSAGAANGTGSDPQLAALIPGYTVYDAATLKFDLIPLSDTIKFRYVFASEEYPEWVGSSFNDVFGFFISGPNPNGGNYVNRNIAIIPGTNLPVTIDNVNSGSYSQYYVNNAGGATIQYDGFTKVLTAWAKVTPCQTYTLKLAVGDAGDSAYDSAVFFEENSLVATGNNISLNVTYSNAGVGGTNAIEGCNNAILNFTLPIAQPTPTVVNFTIGGTATNGVDYANIPNTITVPANQTSASITVVPIIDNIAEGTETITISFQNSICGGTASTTINILDNATLTLTPSPSVSVCNGNAATISVTPAGGVTPYTYQWSNNGGTTQSISIAPNATTTYTVTVADACGQSATAQITVNVGSVTANAGNNQIICMGQSVNLTAYGGVNYLWSNAATTQSINVTPNVSTTYTVTVSDNNGCSDTDDVFVTVNPLPNAHAGPDVFICPNTSTQLNASGGATYIWNPSASLSNGQIANPIAQPSVTTTYIVLATDANGCTQTDNVVVNIYNPPTASAGSNTAICIGNNTTLTASGGTSYLWSTNDNAPSIIVTPVVTTTYLLTVTDNNGCTDTDQVVVTVNSLPLASAGPDISICTGDFGTLNASGGISYAWSPAAFLSNPNIANPLANPTSQTTYTVTVTDNNACSATDNMIISIYQSPVINFVANLYNGCPPLIVNFSDQTIPAIQTWTWDFGDPASGVFNTSSSQNPTHIFNEPGIYSISLTVTTIDGCTKSLTVNNMIQVYPNPVASFTANPYITTMESPIIHFENSSIGAVSYFWNFGEPGSSNNLSGVFAPYHIYANEGVYTVTLFVESVNGCTDSTSATVKIQPMYLIYIPNAFTPNGDGLNDIFKPLIKNYAEYQMYIYDRWGELIFETDNLSNGWDGTVSGGSDTKIMDVYSYLIIVKDFSGKAHQYVGKITLVQ